MTTSKHRNVFISYPHASDGCFVDGVEGWVSIFKKNLENKLNMIGVRDLKLFLDNQESFGDGLSVEIENQLQKAIVFLMMLSSNYVSSGWCPRELDRFIEINGRGAKKRILMAELSDTPERYELHPMVHDLLPMQWYKKGSKASSHLFGWPVPGRDDKNYWDALTELAYEILGVIGSGGVKSQDVKKVWVALPTEDVYKNRVSLVAALKQAQYDVIGLGAVGAAGGDQDFFKALEAPLQEADVFVQLLGQDTGERMNFITPHPQIQYQQMKSVAERRKVPFLVWRDQELVLDGIADAAHRQLLTGIVAGGFQEFIAQVKQALQPISKPATSVSQASKDEAEDSRLKVCVSADSVDSELRKNVRGALSELGVKPISVLEPDGQVPLSVWRKHYGEQLRDSDGLLVLYGSTPGTWVQRRLDETDRCLTSANRQFQRGLLVNAPPEKSNDALEILTEDFDSLVTLDWRQGTCADSLHRFVSQLRGDVGGAHV